MINEKLKNIPERIGYSFSNPNLLEQAFVRRTYSMEHPEKMHNEVLEFIGDKALDLVVIDELISFFSYLNDKGEFVCKIDEGKLTEIKKRLVDEEMLSHRIDILGFADLLIMGNGDTVNKINEKPAVKCDLFESIIGAVTIDSNWDFSAIKRVVDKMLDVNYYLLNGEALQDNNYIGLLQEWYQKKFKEYPVYEIKEINDKNNKKTFVCELNIPGVKTIFQGEGENKQIAKIQVAQKAYSYVTNPPAEKKKENQTKAKPSNKKEKKKIDTYSLENAISCLNEMVQKKKIDKVVYSFSSLKENKVITWTCKAKVKGIKGTFSGKASGKTEAKKKAAYALLRRLNKLEDKKENDIKK
ncbi:MAG: putative dsRNA-binding protein [Bacillales bacterium]|nr:putative dsRNA-binding protein [Bacillales bacterium]